MAKVGANAMIEQHKIHQKEINSIECSHFNPRLFLTSSADGLVKITDLEVGKPVFMYPGHRGLVYEAHFHPKNPEMIASCGIDGTVRIWDMKSQKNVLAIPAHRQEAMTCDFNKYQDIIATGSGDNTIRLWDMRKVAQPIQVFPGHRYAVKKVRYSPWNAAHLLSCSLYFFVNFSDMSVILWDTSQPFNPIVKRHDNHHEFVQGIDWSPLVEGRIASISWDQKLYVWNVMGEQPRLP